MSLRKRLVQFAMGLGVILVLLGHAVQAYRIPLVGALDAFAYDARLRLTLRGGIDERIVIVDLDDRSLAEVGRWPWNRKIMASLVDRLFSDYGISVLG